MSRSRSASTSTPARRSPPAARPGGLPQQADTLPAHEEHDDERDAGSRRYQPPTAQMTAPAPATASETAASEARCRTAARVLRSASPLVHDSGGDAVAGRGDAARRRRPCRRRRPSGAPAGGPPRRPATTLTSSSVAALACAARTGQRSPPNVRRLLGRRAPRAGGRRGPGPRQGCRPGCARRRPAGRPTRPRTRPRPGPRRCGVQGGGEREPAALLHELRGPCAAGWAGGTAVPRALMRARRRCRAAAWRARRGPGRPRAAGGRGRR